MIYLKQRVNFMVVIFFGILILGIVFNYTVINRDTYNVVQHECKCEENRQSYNDLAKDFYNVAVKHGTKHTYLYIYGLYLSMMRYKKIHMLEIGLGCDMSYGPGKSIRVWKEYFRDVTLDIADMNGQCAEKFRKDVNQLFVGDQSDFGFLATIKANNTYDLIIEDGGHSRKQQIHSLISLWESVKPGGIYVIEDLYASIGTNPRQIDYDVSTVEVIHHFITLLNYANVEFSKRKDLDVHFKAIFKSLLSINCFGGVCVLVKRY
jgi:hypothetical protein